MATRKEPSNDDDAIENPINKRRRLEASAAPVASLCLESLNDNCFVHVLSFLEFEDLNSFAICNRRCREVRREESLDQTRSGTILCRKNVTTSSFFRALSERGWTEVFSGNRTVLKIKNIKNIKREWSSTADLFSEVARQMKHLAQLPGVTSLDLSCSPQTVNQRVDCFQIIVCLSRLLLNLRELDFSYLQLNIIESFCSQSLRLCRVTWKGGGRNLDLLGFNLWQPDSLKELYLDDSRFFVPKLINATREEIAMTFQIPNNVDTNYRIWMYCRSLERISMKNVSWSISCFRWEERLPVTQEMIIKFVRHTPTLRWLRSDLTMENVAMLKQERPEVTFVTD